MNKYFVACVVFLFSYSCQAATDPALTSQCKAESKKAVLKDFGGGFTKENEDVINRNCRDYPKEFLCYARKFNAPDADISFAGRPMLEDGCNLPYYQKGAWHGGAADMVKAK